MRHSRRASLSCAPLVWQFLNMILQVHMGMKLERRCGWFRMALMYTISGLGGACPGAMRRAGAMALLAGRLAGRARARRHAHLCRRCPVKGNLLSCIFSPTSVQVGASGAIYGLLGIQLVELLHVRCSRGPPRALPLLCSGCSLGA